MSFDDPQHHVRRVVLPSGKTIEVVYFDDDAPLHEQVGNDLHVCIECSSRLVYPTEWEESGPMHWEVVLHCPNCDWSDVGIFSQEVVERFDDELDRGTEALMRDLQRLSHANMEDEIERFVTALAGDHIVPEDF